MQFVMCSVSKKKHEKYFKSSITIEKRKCDSIMQMIIDREERKKEYRIRIKTFDKCRKKSFSSLNKRLVGFNINIFKINLQMRMRIDETIKI
jgi:hypothetical protein